VLGATNVRKVIEGILEQTSGLNGNCSTSLGVATQFAPSGSTAGISTARGGA
jgi:hypothetical protein